MSANTSRGSTHSPAGVAAVAEVLATQANARLLRPDYPFDYEEFAVEALDAYDAAVAANNPKDEAR